VADGRPFAVLLVELDGVEALLAAERDDEIARAVDAAERALEDLARPGDAIRREAPGRLWLTLPGAGPAGARALALRAAAAVERAADHRGRPLTATVGVAGCPRDGTGPAAPVRDVWRTPRAWAVAEVRSYEAPLAKGPRSTTGATSERPRKKTWTGVPHGSVRCATPIVVVVRRPPQASRRP